MVGFLAVASAGDLNTYVSYAPQAAVHKSYAYAAPQQAYVGKAIYNPAYNHDAYHHGEVLAAPHAAVHKTLAYAAPVTKAIYQQPAYVGKTIYESEPAHYTNYHTYNPTYGHDAYHHGKVLAAPQPYIAKYNTEYVADPHYKTVSAGYPVNYPVAYEKTYATPAVAYEKTYAAPAVAYEKTYATPAVAYEKTYAAPVVHAAHAPAYAKSYAAPIVAAAPALVKSVPVVGHGPIVKSVYPSVVKSYEPDYHHTYGAAPAIVKTAAVAYSPATAVSHTSFESVNAHYGW